MPRLWDRTIDAHRRQVRDAILETTASLAADHGLRAVTMSQIADGAGIGRATLYKYFAGVEEILQAWHQRQVARHLDELAEIRAQPGEPGHRLEAALLAYCQTRHQRGKPHQQSPHGSELRAFLHRGDQLAPAEGRLRDVLRDLLADATRTGDVRDDISSDELVTYCLHALDAAHDLHSDAAAERLVKLVLAGLRPD